MSDKNFLVVEDDPVLAMVTCNALIKRGYHVQHCASLTQAHDMCQHTPFVFALLDLKLEDGISLPLITQLKKNNPNIRILLLTAYASIATAVQAIKLGADNYLAKPASIDHILSALNEENTDTIDTIDNNKMSVRRLEWEHIQQALLENSGNISATARQLNMHRRTLQRKLQKKPVAK